ncbi:hypothetical protein DRQ36_10580 [bacterium]|nr:MAG: hypothetical protein DRQ36_10580 [bacterium]
MPSQKDDTSEIARHGSIIALLGVSILAGYAALHGGGFSESARWLVAFIGIALILLVAAGRKRLFAMPRRTFLIPWVLFLVWGALSSIFSADPDASMGELLTFAGILSAALIAYSLPRDEKDISRMLFILLLGAFAVTAVGWYFYLLGKFTISGGHEMVRHFIGPFFWKNPMAGYLVLFIPVTVCISLYNKGISRWAAAILAVLMLGGLLLTRSRGGWLAFAISAFGILIPCMIIKKTNWQKWLVLVVLLALGIGLGFAFAPRGVIAERAGSIGTAASPDIEGHSAVERVTMLKAGLDIVFDYPILGVGPRAWPAIRAPYLTELKYLPRFPHNAYLRAAAELGIPGFIILLAALVMTFIPLLLKCYLRETSPVAVGITTGCIGLLIHMAVDFHAAFAGILLPFSILAALGLRLSIATPERKALPGRNGILIFGTMSIIILFTRGFATVKYSDSLKATRVIEYDTAIADAHLAAAFNPLSWRIQYQLYTVRMEKGQPELALLDIRSALRLAPTVPDLHLGLARVRAELGDTLEAIAAYRNAIAAAPKGSAAAYLELGDILRAYGRPNEAKRTLISMTEALAPFARSSYTAPTAGFRFKVAKAWEKLADIWSAENDTIMATVARKNALEYGLPRKKDYPLSQLGYESPAPEFVVYEFFESIAKNDTAAVRELIADKEGNLPHFAPGVYLRVEKILDVREEPLARYASVDVILEHSDSTETVGYMASTIWLVMSEGRWAVTFQKKPDD